MGPLNLGHRTIPNGPPFPANSANNGLSVNGSGVIQLGGSLVQATTIQLSGRALLFTDAVHPYLYLNSTGFQEIACLGDFSNLSEGNMFLIQFGAGPQIKTRNRIKFALLPQGTPDTDQIQIGDVELLGLGGVFSVVGDEMFYNSNGFLMMRVRGNNGTRVTAEFGDITLGGAIIEIDSSSRLFTVQNADIVMRSNARTGTMTPLGRNSASGEIETLAGFSGNIIIPAVGTITVLDGIITNFV